VSARLRVVAARRRAVGGAARLRGRRVVTFDVDLDATLDALFDGAVERLLVVFDAFAFVGEFVTLRRAGRRVDFAALRTFFFARAMCSSLRVLTGVSAPRR
ncbi:MAG: hypothetical protein ACREBN_08680, partial [Burkholderiaceae bacterium]